MTTEEFIKDAAARNWSKRQTMQALNLCRETFYAMLEAMPPLVWPAQGRSMGHMASNEAKRGISTQKIRDALVLARAARKAKHMHTVNGVSGTIEQLAALSPVSYSTVRRRLKEGQSLEVALSAPPTPVGARHIKRNSA